MTLKRLPKTSPPGSARLFNEPHAPEAPAAVHTAHVDGASRGNPGPASYAAIIYGPDGNQVFQIGKYLGRDTNNVAEYYALIAALDYAANHAIKRLRVNSDSELLVRQMQGRYKVKSPDLRPLFERAANLARSLEYFAIQHVPREMNRDADLLANEALDRTDGRTAVHGIQKDGAKDGAIRGPKSGAQPVQSNARSVRVRAHYVNGVLVPLEPLDLPDGTEVSFDLRKPLKP
ncbi:MAG TPA: reverse transcriptase-like protein [Candidatus Acidoferrales bacterium]